MIGVKKIYRQVRPARLPRRRRKPGVAQLGQIDLCHRTVRSHRSRAIKTIHRGTCGEQTSRKYAKQHGSPKSAWPGDVFCLNA